MAPTPHSQEKDSSPSIEDDGDQGPNESEVAYLKRKNRALEETLGRLDPNSPNSGSKKQKLSSPTASGRGIRKVADLYHDLHVLISKANMHSALSVLSADEIEELNSIDFLGMKEDEIAAELKDRKRCHTALKIINNQIPNFDEKVASTEDLKSYLSPLVAGAGDARSEDTTRLKTHVATWLNTRNPKPLTPIPISSRDMRGMNNDTTWRLLTPITYDWDDPEVRISLKNAEPDFDMVSSFFFRCLYKNETGNPLKPRQGFLQGPLVIRVYKYVFTSPSSAKSDENTKPTTRRRDVARALGMYGRVTPRSIAYAAVQLVYALSSAPDWSFQHAGIHYPTFYNFLTDYFEDASSPTQKKNNEELLKWWNLQIFPKSKISESSCGDTALVASQKLMEQEDSDEYDFFED